MISLIKFILIIIIYIVSSIIAIPILIARISFVMSSVMFYDIMDAIKMPHEPESESENNNNNDNNSDNVKK